MLASLLEKKIKTNTSKRTTNAKVLDIKAIKGKILVNKEKFTPAGA